MIPELKLKKALQELALRGANDHCSTIRNIIPASYPTSTTVKTGIEGKAVVKEMEYISRMLNLKSFNL